MAKANSTRSKSKGASARNASTVLKCKTGDLAIVLGDCEYEGYVVTVGAYHGPAVMSDGGVMVNAWRVHHFFKGTINRIYMEDKYLMPIRPGDLDETETDELYLVKEVSA